MVTTFVNGWKVGKTRLAGNFQSYAVPIPGSVIRPGENIINFRYAFSGAPPGSVAASEKRPLAVAWDWLALTDTKPAPEPHTGAAPQATDSSLSLPFGTRLDYFAEVQPPVRLRVSDMRPWGSNRVPAGSDLEIQVTWGKSSAVRSYHFDPATVPMPLEIPLPIEGASLARISFIANSSGDSDGATGLVLVRPALLAVAGACRGLGAEVPPAHTASARSNGSRARPNVLIYLIDTLRADHLGAYGYPKPVSPNIDAFAADAVVFSRAFAQSGWTKSSVTSVLTGLTPFTHHVLDRSDALPANVQTLPSLLRNLGYETFGAVANPTISVEFGFARGFNRFVPLYTLMDKNDQVPPHSDRVGAELISWLRRRDTSAPFFAYLHTMDPHEPYVPPEPYRRRFAPTLHSDLRTTRQELIAAARLKNPGLTQEMLKADFEALYDGEIAFNDEQFGRLVHELKRDGLYESTLIVLVSDHGEEFLDHGHWGHGHTLYSELLHIPLIVRLPSQPSPGRKITSTVQHVDIVPTILDALGAPTPPNLEGQSLLPVLTNSKNRPSDRVVLSLLDLDDYRISSALYHQRHLLLWNDDNPVKRIEFFDLQTDPRELHDVRFQEKLWAGYLLGFLSEARERSGLLSGAPHVRITSETEKRLRALGYIH